MPICNKCNKNRRYKSFRIAKSRGKEIYRRQCIDCEREASRLRNVNLYRTDPVFRERALESAENRRRKRGVMPLEEYRASVSCGLTRSEQSKKWRDNNPEKVKELGRKNHQKAKISGESAKSARKYRRRRKKSPERYQHAREYFRTRAQKDRDDLNDNYVKYVLTLDSELSFPDIPPELVELKREQLKLKRQLGNSKKAA